MNYDLAKKLAKAGFPHGICEWTDEHPDRDSNEHVPIPTLSELIEACGDNLEVLRRPYAGEGWFASDGKSKQGIGLTPEEAVATLWLSLKDNKNV